VSHVASGLAARQAPLVGRRVRLRAVKTEDLDFLYALNTRPELGFRWRHGGEIPSPENFVAELWRGVFVQFVIESQRSEEPVGIVTALNWDGQNRVADVGMALAPEVSGIGWPIEAAVLFVNYLFVNFDLRKLYAISPQFNFVAVERTATKYGTIEGHLHDHHYYNGNHWDVAILSIDRSQWSENRQLVERLLRRFRNA
jgi:RimJ/RimL family protein N-acetyltransferase